MAKIDIKNSNFVVLENDSLEEVMKSITANHKGSAVVVDEEWHVIGITTDGIIRRAMLRGAVMQTLIREALNYNVVSLKEGKMTSQEGKALLEKYPYFNIFPVVDGKNILVNLIIRGND